MMRTADSFARRLANLTAKSAAAQWQSPPDLDWDRPARLPLWLPRRLAASAITRFRSGELATAGMCRHMRGRIELPAGRDFLDMQALEEQRHARLYSLYLDKLGGADRRPSSVAKAYERAVSWQGPPQAVILAFHGILEGESMRLQREIDKWLPCPLFRDIGAVIACDEARHIAFGRLYLRESLPSLPRAERLDMYRWIRSLWFEEVTDAISQFAPPGMVKPYGGLAGWMANEWRERIDDMESLRLFASDERRDFLAAC